MTSWHLMASSVNFFLFFREKMGDEYEDDFMVEDEFMAEHVPEKVQGDEDIIVDNSEKQSKSKNPQKSGTRKKKRYLAFVGMSFFSFL